MMPTRRFRILLTLVVLTVVVTSCSDGTTPNASSDGTQVIQPIRVAQAAHNLFYLPLYIAQREGLFADEGLDVTVNTAGSGPNAIAAVTAGEAQFSLQGPEHAAFAVQKGAQLKLVSAVVNIPPVWIVAGKGTGIDSVDDLAGKTVAVTRAPSTTNTILKRVLSENGVTAAKTIETAQGNELGPLVAGQADAAALTEPGLERAKGEGATLIYSAADVYADFSYSVMTASSELVTDEPELVKKFVRAVQEAIEMIRDQPGVAQRVAVEEFPQLPADQVKQAVLELSANGSFPKNGVGISRTAFDNALALQRQVRADLTEDVKYEELVAVPDVATR